MKGKLIKCLTVFVLLVAMLASSVVDSRVKDNDAFEKNNMQTAYALEGQMGLVIICIFTDEVIASVIGHGCYLELMVELEQEVQRNFHNFRNARYL